MKPCPRCNGRAELCREAGRFYVACTGGNFDPHCDLKGPTATTKEVAIARWDHRGNSTLENILCYMRNADDSDLAFSHIRIMLEQDGYDVTEA